MLNRIVSEVSREPSHIGGSTAPDAELLAGAVLKAIQPFLGGAAIGQPV